MKALLSILFCSLLPAAWLTHVIVCLLQAKYVLLLAGAIISPVGVIHGFGLWFGVNW